MKLLSVVALVVAAVGAQAQSVVSTLGSTQLRAPNLHDKTVTVNLQGVSLEKALKDIASQAGVQIGFADEVTSYKKPVSVKVESVSLAQAFSVLLKPTGLVAVEIPGKNRFIVKSDTQGKARNFGQGIITGKVTDAKSGKGIEGVSISVADGRGVVSAKDGSYRLVGITTGSHILSVRLVGYAKQIRPIIVGDGATVTADFKLEPSTNVLDQVVVTGTITQTELKAVPNAITVVTAREIEERGITRIDQLFRGDIPGLFASTLSYGSQPGDVQMSSRGGTTLRDGAIRQPIKTYVDGVELADPTYLGLIDPKSIERIEILTGPQASAIYGSNAINGVMQVFTKRGSTTKPQFVLLLQSGLIQSNYSSGLTPQHDHGIQISGVQGNASYNFGSSWVYVGPWTPDQNTTTTSGFGGIRLEMGELTADFSTRRVVGVNRMNGGRSRNLDGVLTGEFNVTAGSGVAIPRTYKSSGQTLSTTLLYTPVAWWSNTINIGSDVMEANSQETRAAFMYPGDTSVSINPSNSTRTSLSYNTTGKAELGTVANMTITAGADGWNALQSSSRFVGTNLSGSFSSPSNSFSSSRIPSHNRGAFLQTQVGIIDAVFLTYGLRAEWNPTYGDEVTPNVTPTYGIAYTQDLNTPLGAITLKARGSYGRSTRPPARGSGLAKPRSPGTVEGYGPGYDLLGNQDLLPEHQQGGEGGIELYVGNRGSLTVTRYNQTVNDLIQAIAVDSSDLVPALLELYSAFCQPWVCHIKTFQDVNVGSIRNQGWETQGTVRVGPLSTKGTYSYTKSRLISFTQKFRSQNGNFVPGASFSFIPEHTYAVQIQYASAGTTINYNLRGQGQLTLNGFENFSAQSELFKQIDIKRLKAHQAPRYQLPQGFVGRSTGYGNSDINASHTLSNAMTANLQILNVTNNYRLDATGAGIGRQTKLGVRIKW